MFINYFCEQNKRMQLSVNNLFDKKDGIPDD